MIQSAIVVKDRLQQTPNANIERKELPTRQGGSIEIEVEFVPPRDPLENALAKIWAKILRVNRAGPNDNFFELGGHSLAAVLMLFEVQKLTGKTLPLSTMQPLGSSTPLFLVHGAEGNVLLYLDISA